jgi:septal ring factor EnvC (AmiA/AmiB activator)
LKAQLDQRGKASAQLAQALKDSEAKNTALESELARVHTEMDTYLRNFDTLAQSTQKVRVLLFQSSQC